MRVLTNKEMRELPEGAIAFLTIEGADQLDGGADEGDICFRVYKDLDDTDSVAFKVESLGDWFYLCEGDIAVADTEHAELGVFRPELETRKVGKVRVELVDDGFPLALREVAKVMTWAQTAKGYKDHDWQNLPNAEIALAAAASRHRTDHITQRVVGKLAIGQCVDNESSLLHKAHEAFGVLAQLELMLRGDFA